MRSRFPRRWGLLCTLLAALCCHGACEPPHPPIPDDPVLLYTRSVFEPIYLEDLPFPEEIGVPVRLSATPGEYESASIGVFSRVPLRDARLIVAQLAGPGDAVIDTDALDVKITRYIDPMRRWPRIKKHPKQPGYLDPIPSVDIPADRSQQFWLTVHVPEQTPAGSYTGELTFRAEGIEALPLRLTVDVLPFTLGETTPDYFLAGDSFPLDEQAFVESRAHGMNTICIKHGWPKQIVPRFKGGQFSYRADDFERLKKVVDLAQKHGLAIDRPVGIGFYSQLTRSVPAALHEAKVPGPDGSLVRAIDYLTGYEQLHRKGPGTDDVVRHEGVYYPTDDPSAPPNTEYGQLLYQGWIAAFQRFEQYARAQGWEETWYWLIDEPHQSRGSMRLAIQMLTAAKKASVSTFVTCNEPTVSEPDPDEHWFPALMGERALLLEPWIDHRCYHNRYLGPVTRERARDAGDGYGTYINVYGNQPPSTRHMAGLFAWRLDFDHAMLWSFNSLTDEIDGKRAYLRDWEAAREGIDDLRYLERLERALEQGHGSSESRARAEALLKEIHDSIEPDVRSVGVVDGVSGEWVPGRRSWAPEEYDRIRHRVASMIVELLGEAQTDGASPGPP